jgi:His-Xaa-Ser system radical SAM maturase HxsC
MCPQPPCADESSQHLENLRILSLLKGDVKMLAITGGEPTLFPDRLIEYFSIINKKFPRARVEILTNASLLSDFNVAKKIALATPYDTCFCVSIHGDTGSLAESIMRCPKGWDKALTGIWNLAKLHQQIEIRVVVTKNNAPYIEDIAQFLYRNFPFVSHIAFMGQEIIGEARNNFESIWVDPIQYVANLDKAVRYLAGMGVNTSIYNIPLCLLPESSRRYAARSISDWKQEYKGECCGCDVKDQCCGFFTTSGDVMPTGICKIKNEHISNLRRN